jgi:hypothetical protein
VSSIVSHCASSISGVGSRGLGRCVYRTLKDENIQQDVLLLSLFSILYFYGFRAFIPPFVLFLCPLFLPYLRLPIELLFAVNAMYV